MDANFDDADVEAIDDEDGLDDGTEMVIDTQLLIPNGYTGLEPGLGIGQVGLPFAATAAGSGPHQEALTAAAQTAPVTAELPTTFASMPNLASEDLGGTDAVMDLAPGPVSHFRGSSLGNAASLAGPSTDPVYDHGVTLQAAFAGTSMAALTAELSGSGSSSSIGDEPSGA